jgi:tetratricopeptide (TPR) repeat protein
VLIVATHRPEFAPRWAGQPHVVALTLSRLSRREAGSMAQKVTAGKALPAEVLDHIVSKTDGIPLFVEEMTKALVESGSLRDAGDRYELTAPLSGLAVPGTLQGSLMSRLDRAPSLREVAQVGACIGREFSHGLLAATMPLPAAELHAALEGLVEAELLFRRGPSSDPTYSFKHALVQDAAYDSILKSKRLEVHRAIARALEGDTAGLGEPEPQLLAMHFERGGQVGEAIAWYRKAGESAKARSANREAIQSFERALSLLGQIDESEERKWAEVSVRANLGMLHMSLHGWTSSAARAELTRAEGLSTDHRGDVRRLAVLVGLVESLTWELRMAEASRATEELVEIATRTGERIHELFAWQVESRMKMYRGRFRDALEQALRLIERYDETRDIGLAFEYGYDPAVYAMSTVAYTFRELGYLDQAQRWLERCVALGRKCAHPYTLSFALSTPGVDMSYLMRLPEQVLRFAREGSQIAREGQFPHQQAMCDVHEGWAIAVLGQAAEGLERMARAMDTIRALGLRALIAPRMTAQLASVYALIGDADEGLRVLADSPDRQPGSRRVRYAEIYRIEGDLHLQKRAPDEQLAEACYREAISIAIEDEAKTFELRASTSLARLWQKQGKRREAHQTLAAVYGRFTEGFEYPDLRGAKALLDELGP